MTDITDVVRDTPHAAKRVQDAIEALRDTARDARMEADRVESVVVALEAGDGDFSDTTWLAAKDAANHSAREAVRAQTALEMAAWAARDALQAARATADIIWATKEEEGTS